MINTEILNELDFELNRDNVLAYGLMEGVSYSLNNDLCEILVIDVYNELIFNE